MVFADVFLIQELRGDDDGAASGRASLLRGVQGRAVVAGNVAAHAVKDDYSAGNGWGWDQSREISSGSLAEPCAVEMRKVRLATSAASEVATAIAREHTTPAIIVR